MKLRFRMYAPGHGVQDQEKSLFRETHYQMRLMRAGNLEANFGFPSSQLLDDLISHAIGYRTSVR